MDMSPIRPRSHPARPAKGGPDGLDRLRAYLGCRPGPGSTARYGRECPRVARGCGPRNRTSVARSVGYAVSAPSTSGADAANEVSRLREQRTALEVLIRDLMKWIGLLHHKAFSLRALAAGSPRTADQGTPAQGDGLTPGSLDPRALAEALSGDSPRPSRDTGRRPARLLRGLGAEEAIARARSLWDTVVDPADTAACERLSEAADRLAIALQARVDEALDQYAKLGDELVHALERVRHLGTASGNETAAERGGLESGPVGDADS